MSGYDITADMSDWDYALYNTQRDRKRRVDALVKKYGFPIREQDLLEEDYVEYDLLKNDLQSMEKEEPVNYALLRNLSPEDEDTNDYASTSNAGNNSAKKYTIPKRKDTFGDKVAEAIATSDTARKTVLALQGALDSYINPVGLLGRELNYIKTGKFTTGLEHFEPENGMEKFIEFMGDFASGAGPAVKTGKAATTAAVTQFDRQMFAKAYRKVYKELLEKNPGEADEIMATIHRFFSDNIHIQRGAAAFTKDGKLITQGKELQRATQRATKRNFGLTKEIGLHNMTEKEVKALPQLLRQYKPVEVTDSGQMLYKIRRKDGRIRKIATSLREINGKLKRVIVSDYWIDDLKTPVRELLK